MLTCNDFWHARIRSRLRPFADGVVGGLSSLCAAEVRARAPRYTPSYDLAVAGARTEEQGNRSRCSLVNYRGVAAEIGPYIIFVQADPIDDPAIALYESIGSPRRRPAFRYTSVGFEGLYFTDSVTGPVPNLARDLPHPALLHERKREQAGLVKAFIGAHMGV